MLFLFCKKVFKTGNERGQRLTKKLKTHMLKLALIPKLEKKLRLLQYRNRNKELKSAKWKEAQVKIARLHKRIVNICYDYVHKMTTYLAKNHSNIVIPP